MDVEKCPSLQIYKVLVDIPKNARVTAVQSLENLGSDLQGQNPGVVGFLDCFLCLDDL